MPQKNIIHLTATEMEIKFVECNMEQVLRGCDCERIQREDYGQPMKKKREHGYVYSKNLKLESVSPHLQVLGFLLPLIGMSQGYIIFRTMSTISFPGMPA